jgi:hypothetical protein
MLGRQLRAIRPWTSPPSVPDSSTSPTPDHADRRAAGSSTTSTPTRHQLDQAHDRAMPPPASSTRRTPIRSTQEAGRQATSSTTSTPTTPPAARSTASTTRQAGGSGQHDREHADQRAGGQCCWPLDRERARRPAGRAANSTTTTLAAIYCKELIIR